MERRLPTWLWRLWLSPIAWQKDNPDASANDTALWWLNSKPDIWESWVTPEAAEAIQ